MQDGTRGDGVRAAAGNLPEKDLLEAREVADYFGVGEVTIYRWCREGSLSCMKIGKSWRIRREALLEFLGERERPATLTGRLRSFIEVPDNVIAVGQGPEHMHRLDAAFFRAGEARGGLLLKYHAGGDTEMERLRQRLEDYGLEAGRLEQEGRMHLLPETRGSGDRLREMRRVREEAAQDGRTVWAAFDWEERVSPETALEHQEKITELVESTRLVVKTAVPENLAYGWPAATWFGAQAAHSGTVWLSEAGISTSRVAPVRAE